MTLNELIDSRPLSKIQLKTLILCSLVLFIDGFDLQALAIVVPQLAADWKVPVTAFAVALSASLLGYGLGSAILAGMGDRFGRRVALVGGVLAVGLTTLLAVTSTSPAMLAGWRLLAGVSLGVTVANALALASEFVPARSRFRLIGIASCCIPLGTLVSGVAAGWLIQRFGWQGMFWTGGIAPIMLGALLFGLLPESPKLLHQREGPDSPRMRRILLLMVPDLAGITLSQAVVERTRRTSVMELLAPPYRARTLLLWALYLVGSSILFLLVSWVPTLLRQAGFSNGLAGWGAALFSLGGIGGGLLLSWAVDRDRTSEALAAGYGMAMLAAVSFGMLGPSFGSWAALLLLLGMSVSGGQVVILGLASSFYPPLLRAAGIGWSMAVARFGTVISPLLGGWALAAGWSGVTIMAVLGLPIGVMLILSLVIRRVWRRSDSDFV